MSHFNLAIFTLDENPNLDEIMEPFFEGNRVEPYIDMTKSELIEDARRQMQCIFETRYAEWKAHPSEYEKGVNPSHIEYLKKLPELMKRSDEELYQEAIEGYEEDDLDEDGNLLSTCNPNSKWDWYEVGGRWHGMLLLKPGKKGSRGSPGLMTPASGNSLLMKKCSLLVLIKKCICATAILQNETISNRTLVFIPMPC